MDPARHAEDPDKGYRQSPKLILAGRLTGTLDGRPVVISADDTGLTLDLSSLRSVWTLRKFGSVVLPFVQFLNAAHVPLRLRLLGGVSVPVLPKAGLLVRLFVPELGRG